MLANHPAASHVGVRIAALPVGNINGESFAECLVTIIAANGLEVPCADVTVDRSTFPRLDIVQSAIRYDISTEPPSLLPDATDAEIFYPNRTMIRAYIGIVDAAVHADLDELMQCVNDFVTDVQRMYKQYGATTSMTATTATPGSGPVFRIFMFNASERHLDLARRFGSFTRFISTASGHASQLLSISVLLTELTENVFHALECELKTIQEAEDSGAITVTPDALAVSAVLPRQFSGHLLGGIHIALLHGVSGFSLIGGGAKKRLQGRLNKHRAALALMAGSPADALEFIDRAVKALKPSNDLLFLGLAYELNATALILDTALGRGVPASDVPYMPEVTAMLRESVNCMDALAATPELGAIIDVIIQLSVSMRLRLVRYLLCQPPQRALTALSVAMDCADRDIPDTWIASLTTRPKAEDPRITVSPIESELLKHRCIDEYMAVDAEKSTAKQKFGVHQQTAAPADSSMGMTNILRTVSAITPDTKSAAATSGLTSPTTTGTYDIAEALTVAAGRCRDIRNPQCVIKSLLQCADLLELAGFARKADACLSRACRTLRSLQPVPNMENLLPRRVIDGGSDVGIPSGCIYTALRIADQTTPYSELCARAAKSKVAPWPLPWFDNSDICPTTAPYRFTPALSAALLTLTMACRDPSCAAVLCNDLGLLNRNGKGGARILNAASTMLEWLPTVIADLWQCAELPLASVIACLTAALDPCGDTHILLPAATSALRSVELAELSPSMMPTPLNPDAARRTCPVQRADNTAFSRMRNRRYMCQISSSSMVCGSPMALVRTLLHRTTINHALSPLDSLCCLQLLRASALEHRASVRHSHAAAVGVESLHVDDATAVRDYGLADALLMDPCCAPAAAALQAVSQDPSAASQSQSPSIRLIGGIDKSALSLQYGDTSMSTILWNPAGLAHQLASYCLISSAGLTPMADTTTRFFNIFISDAAKSACARVYLTSVPFKALNWTQFSWMSDRGEAGVHLPARNASGCTPPQQAPTPVEAARTLLQSKEIFVAPHTTQTTVPKWKFFAENGAPMSSEAVVSKQAAAALALPTGASLQLHGSLQNQSSLAMKASVIFFAELASTGQCKTIVSNRTFLELLPRAATNVVVTWPALPTDCTIRLKACLLTIGPMAVLQKVILVAGEKESAAQLWDLQLSAAETREPEKSEEPVTTFADYSLASPIPIMVYGTSWAIVPTP